MATKPVTALCSGCQLETQTFLYHGPEQNKLQLCKDCYDHYLAKEMVNYWKDHIAEEQRRTKGRVS